MIRGVHAMFYSSKADEMRAFIRDKLKLQYTDVGEGWLIFDFPEGDLGVHPTDGDPPTGTPHVSFYCDDIGKTMADLSKRGVIFDSGVEDHGYGLVTSFTMPGDVKVQLYQPKYTKGVSRTTPPWKEQEKKKAAKKAAPKKKAAAKPAKAARKAAPKKKAAARTAKKATKKAKRK